MGQLSSIFRDRGGQGLDGDPVELERHLDALCARGRAAYPQLDVDAEAFVAHLARCGASVADALGQVHAEDLYLAHACLAGNAGAVALLREAFHPSIAKHLKRVDRSAPIHEEVEQKLWDALLVGGPDGPKLATYAGRGPLGGWIGISAQRIALMMLRHERAESRARNEVAARNRLATDDPEMAAIKDRYRTQFQQAVDAAIATLDDRDRTIYRMHLVDGVTLARIGKAYGVTHPTVLRWLERARQGLVDEAKRRLRETLPVSSAEFDSIVRLLVSQIDLSVSSVLAKKA